MNSKVLIVEDEVIIADYIHDILIENEFKNIILAHDKDSAESIIANHNPDLIILDINLSGNNEGIDIAKNYRGNARIIFLTGQHDHSLMTMAIATRPASYLTKPIKRTDLIAALQLSLYVNEQQFYILKDGFNKVRLKFEDILFVKAAKNYVEIQLENRKYVERTTLKEIENLFPTHHSFKRVHRSYLVNIKKAASISRSSMAIGTFKIPLGRSYFKAAD